MRPSLRLSFLYSYARRCYSLVAATIFTFALMGSDFEIDVSGQPRSGMTPRILAWWNGRTLTLVLEYRWCDKDQMTDSWFKLSYFSADVYLISSLETNTVTNHLHTLPLTGLKKQMQLSDLLARFPRDQRGTLWLTLLDSRSAPMQLSLGDIAFARTGIVDKLIVRPILYKVPHESNTAKLIEFDPLEIQLPPFEANPSPTAPAPAPSPRLYSTDPDLAKPDRGATLADLPVPSASWLPWAAWGTAAAALLAAGLLHRCRRRAASREKSGN